MIEVVAADGNLRRLKALIHPDNASSLRAFERAGFRRQETPEAGFLVLLRQLLVVTRPGEPR
jgi:RimJ/RimL family protein N-acetyltransferase